MNSNTFYYPFYAAQVERLTPVVQRPDSEPIIFSYSDVMRFEKLSLKGKLAFSNSQVNGTFSNISRSYAAIALSYFHHMKRITAKNYETAISSLVNKAVIKKPSTTPRHFTQRPLNEKEKLHLTQKYWEIRLNTPPTKRSFPHPKPIEIESISTPPINPPPVRPATTPAEASTTSPGTTKKVSWWRSALNFLITGI